MDRKEKKIALQKQIDKFNTDLKSIMGDFKLLGKDVLIISGIIFSAYALMRLFEGDDKNEDEDISESILSSAFTAALTSLMLSLLKDKLLQYLESLNLDEDE